MSIPPPHPEHFTSAPPPPAPRAPRNVLVGVLAALVVIGALADAFMANRRARRAEEHARHEKAARHAAELARQGEMRRAAAQVEALKKRMHAIAVDAGVVAAPAPGSGPDDGGARP